MKPNEFVDCVAFGLDAHWAGNSALKASNAVLTAGCDEFTTCVFVGHDWCWVGPIPSAGFEKSSCVQRFVRCRHRGWLRAAYSDKPDAFLEEGDHHAKWKPWRVGHKLVDPLGH